jgi:hypothetical protein
MYTCLYRHVYSTSSNNEGHEIRPTDVIEVYIYMYLFIYVYIHKYINTCMYKCICRYV